MAQERARANTQKYAKTLGFYYVFASKLGRKMTQDRPKMAQDNPKGPKMAEDSTTMDHDSAKMAQDGP